MKEIWKKIEEYNDYQVSNLGRVKSLKNKKEKVLKPSKNSSGYLQVVLSKNGKVKSHFIHKLVAKAFVDNKNKYIEVNHIDENKTNNFYSNLEWCDRKYNMNYGTIKAKQAKAQMKKVAKLSKDGKVLQVYESIKEAAKANNCIETHIVACCRHKNHYITHKGYKWEYF